MTQGISITEEYLQQADELVRLLDDCPTAAFNWRIGAPRRSIIEIVSRRADSELLAAVRLRRIIAQDRPRRDDLEDDEVERWARCFDYQHQDLEEVVLRLTVLRRANGALLEQLAYEDWRRVGEHDQAGELSLFHLVEREIAETNEALDHVRAIIADFAAQNGHADIVPAPLVKDEVKTEGRAKFYALAFLAGLTIFTVGFFTQSLPVYIFGGIVTIIGVLLVLLSTLRKE